MLNWIELKKQYVDLIETDFWPYWAPFDDAEFGGILNCITNDGSKQLSDRKFSWSQGRYLWVLAELIDLSQKDILKRLDKKDLLKKAQRTKSFLVDHCISPDYEVYYLLTREGEPVKDERTGQVFASIFSDCFVSIGLSNYIRVSGDKSVFNLAQNLFVSIVKRIQSGNYLTEPYPIPQGYVSHSIPMILLNTAIEFEKALLTLNNQDDLAFCLAAQDYAQDQIMNTFFNPKTSLMREYVSTDENFATQLQDRHVNPGHTIEDTWFLLEYYTRRGLLEGNFSRLEKLAQNSWAIGWDKEYGGLLRYVDKDGGEPKGEAGQDAFEKLIQDTWSMKLWWPHSETLYTFLKLYSLNPSTKNKEIYRTSAEYIFRTFPNRELGEWIQIRDRRGKPEEKVVALPVKDPFHILRNFLRIVELASEEVEK
jgi:N-acylglucosamine 2-epimerase